MMIPSDKVVITKHWLNQDFSDSISKKSSKYYTKKEGEKVLLFVGRISEEKGLFDFPDISEIISKEVGPVKVIFCGRGPAKEKIQERMPEAIFIDWVDQTELGGIYSQADFFIFPSRFDTFGRVVLEALSCGCPVAAYDEKGPKDIIENGKSGILRNNKQKLAEAVAEVLKDEKRHQTMRTEAVNRSKHFDRDSIINLFLNNTGLGEYAEAEMGQPAEVAGK